MKKTLEQYKKELDNEQKEIIELSKSIKSFSFVDDCEFTQILLLFSYKNNGFCVEESSFKLTKA